MIIFRDLVRLRRVAATRRTATTRAAGMRTYSTFGYLQAAADPAKNPAINKREVFADRSSRHQIMTA